MNERIKKLAEQAGFQYIKDEGIGWAGNYNDSLPKFAELIVRECMNICNVEKSDYDKHRKNAWDTEEKVIYNEGGAACDTIKHKMKHHFGVEE